jgi:hypothetical protein
MLVKSLEEKQVNQHQSRLKNLVIKDILKLWHLAKRKEEQK